MAETPVIDEPTAPDRPIGTMVSRNASTHPATPIFRFGLRNLLAFVAFLSVLFAAMGRLEGISAVALLLAVSVVSLHLLASAIGRRSRLHAHRDTSVEWIGAPPIRDVAQSARVIRPDIPNESSSSPWYGQNATTLAWMPRFVAVAFCLGGLLGGIGLAIVLDQRLSPAGFVVGTISSAALSGWFAFLSGNFLRIVRGGLVESDAGPRGKAHLSAPR